MCGIWLKKKRSREKKRELLLIVRWCWDAAAWSNKNLTDADIHTVYGGTGGIGTQGPSEQFWIWWGPITSKRSISLKKVGKTITTYTLAHFFSLLRSYLFGKTWLGQITTVPHTFRRACIGSRSLLARLVVILLLCQGSFFFMLCTSHAHFVMWAWHLAVLSGVYPSPSRSELHNSGP